MGIWINPNGYVAHRDDIPASGYVGELENCKKYNNWMHEPHVPAITNADGTKTITVGSSTQYVKPCGNCHPW